MRSSSVIWTDPKAIRFKISPHDDLAGVQDGNWDIERRFALETSVKFRSIVQRYAEKRPWEETDLFTDAYRRRFDAGESIRGEATMEGLLTQYRTRVDGMFKAMQRKGFDAQHTLPKFLLGRGGEVFIGNQGNHRLAMARIIGLPQIAGEIVCRHSESSR